MKKIQIINVWSDIAGEFTGCVEGVSQLNKMIINDFEDHSFAQQPENIYLPENFMDQKYDIEAKEIGKVYLFCNEVASKINSVLNKKYFPFVIAGDHSTSAGTISGIKTAFPNLRIGIIWIDAHADLHSPFTTPSGNLHGMPLAIVLSEDNHSMRLNAPDDPILNMWKNLKNISNISPKIKYSDLVFIGVRALEAPEEYLILKHNINNFHPRIVHEKGGECIANEAINLLNNCDLIYISLDVDCLDPSISRGTGTPISNGLFLEETVVLINTLLKSNKICCFEIAEINPNLDKEKNMTEIAYQIVQVALNNLVKTNEPDPIH